MKNINPDKIQAAEVIPHRKSKDKSGKGAKTPCPGNIEGNGSHIYEVVKETILRLNYSPYSFIQKECIGCGKHVPMNSFTYTGDFYEERISEYWGRNSDGPIYHRIK